MTSGQPGFYASAPIRDAGRTVVGVAVVKRILGPSSFGPAGSMAAFLVGPDGRVLVSSGGVFEGRPMWPAARSPEAAPAESLPLLGAPWLGSTWARVDGARYLAVRARLPALDWSVVTMRREYLRGTNRLLGILITLLLSMAIVATFLILQRQLGAESRLARKHREAEGRAREMARRADTDALTGVANRQGFNEAIAREFARGRRFHHPLSVILVDLDHFKRVNDRFGHAVGDQALVATARLLSTRVRVSDLVARWGGEEFVVIASTTNAAGAARLAEKLRALLEAAPPGPAGTLTASFGVAEMRLDDTVETMLRRADEALYEAKAKGRNQVRCAESWVDMAAVTAGAAEAPEGAGRAAHMETGFAPVDDEHRALTAAIADFTGLVTRGDEARTKDAMPVLIGRIAEHFAAEDSLMRRCAYPARSRHEEAHVLFVADMKRFQLELERGGLTPGFLQWATARLPEWFRYHILAHDVALGKFLVAQGPGVAGTRREA